MSTRLTCLGGACSVFLFSALLQAQHLDTAYSSLVLQSTSDPSFLAASVATLPDHPTIPSPKDHFGTIAGAEGVMHHSAEIYGYLRALAAATPRVRVERVGTTEEGREIVLAVVADETTMQRLDHYRALAARLADPRRVPAEQLAVLLEQAKPIYYLNGGLHSPEMGSPEMLLELAYRLAASDAPEIRNIREKVITIINPVSEPDGRDRQVDWYYRYTRKRTDWDDGFPGRVPYWGKYVYHDNNRDGIQISQALTKAAYRIYFDWHPVVMHDLHESVPLLYVSTGTGPYNETIDPITIGEWQVLANHDVTTLTAQGLPGVWSWGFYDGWWPGYLIWIANNHNAIGRFYETFGNAGANTFIRDLASSRYAGDPVTSREWYRPWPPTRKVRWSARDNVNYMQAGVLASLGYTADNGRTLLRNFWQKGVNNIERGRREAPHAFVIPALERQRDPRRAAYLVNQLLGQQIEVHRRGVAPLRAAEGNGNSSAADSAGDFVVLLDQPYRNLAVSLLTKQNFPADADHPPYDDIAWTLGYLYGVEVKPVDDSTVFRWAALERLRDSVEYRGRVLGQGSTYAIAQRGQAELLPALYWLRERGSRARASSVTAPFVAGPDSFPAGSLLLEGLDRKSAGELTERFGLTLHALATTVDAPRHALDLPRVAIYHTWTNTQDEGWVRFTFEQSGIPYTSIHKDDLRRGELRRRFDVILVPTAGGSVDDWIHELDKTWGPMPYTKTAEFPSHGSPSATADMTGGPGFEGLAELQRFVEGGGVLLTIEGAVRLAAETGIARALEPMSAGNLFHPGSVVRAKARRPEHPILYGFPETTHLFRGNAPLYQVARRDRGMMVLQYGTKKLRDEEEDTTRTKMLGIPLEEAKAKAEAKDSSGVAVEGAQPAPQPSPSRPDRSDSYVLSGMVRNQDQIIGHGAIFDVPVGHGRVVAFTFNPLHRYLNHHEFPLVWNTLMHWNDLPHEKR